MKPSNVVPWLPAAALAALFSVAPGARAQPAAGGPSTPAEVAAEHARTGAAAAARGDYEACAKAFLSALVLDSSARWAGELGLCEEALGWYPLAYDHLVRAVAGAPPPALGGTTAEPWKRYDSALERIKKRVARAFVLVDDNEAEVWVDDRSLGTHVDGRYFGVTPGKHVWTAKRPDGTVVRFEHEPNAGDLPSVNLVFGLKGPPPAVPPPSAAPPPQPPCEVAGGEPMSPRLCALFQRVYGARVNPTVGAVLGGLLSVGYTADAGGGLYGAVDLRWNDAKEEDWGFVLTGEVRALLPAKVGTYGNTGAYTLSLGVVSGGLAPCLRYKVLLGCAIVDAGAHFVSGPNLGKRNSDFGPALGIGPRFALDLPVVGRFGIRVFADLRFGPLPATESVNNVVLWREPPVSGLFGLGVAFK